jgi:hypothetical protein
MTNTFFSGLVHLGAWFRGEIDGEGSNDEELLRTAEAQNRWFTPDFMRQAMEANGEMLQAPVLRKWVSSYPGLDQQRSPKKVGLVLAGNLPMVGWHDVLSVLIAGHHAVVKCSSEDKVLIPAAIRVLEEALGAEFDGRLAFVQGTLQDVDAVIATGSANTNRYFEYYFRDLPKILRSQRTSVAVLDGSETHSELQALGSDVFRYYGLGCRSVTKLMLPRGFDLDRLFGAWVDWGFVAQNNKYANNYDYHKAVWLLNQEQLLENGFLLMKEDEGWMSPVGTLFYEWYDDLKSVSSKLNESAGQLQCVSTRLPASELAENVPCVSLGQTQNPSPWDYADGVDTLNFLLALSS